MCWNNKKECWKYYQKRDILNLYKDDIVKYSGDKSVKVQSIFEEIPSQLQKHEKRFSFNAIQKDSRYRDYKDAFFWLQESMIVNIAYIKNICQQDMCYI